MVLCVHVKILNAEKRASVKDVELKIMPSTQLKLPEKPKGSEQTQAGQYSAPSTMDFSDIWC